MVVTFRLELEDHGVVRGDEAKVDELEDVDENVGQLARDLGVVVRAGPRVKSGNPLL